MLRGLGQASVALLYLLPVIAMSTRAGLGPGLFTGAASALAYNFFLLPPRYTLDVADPDNVMTLAILLGVAAITSKLAARLRSEAERSNLAARANAEIAAFGRKIALCDDEPAIGALLLSESARLFEARAALVRVDDDTLEVTAAEPSDPVFGSIDRAAALWAQAHQTYAGRGAETVASADWLFAPAIETLLLALARDDAKAPVEVEFMPLLHALTEHARAAAARLRIVSEQRKIEASRERDALRAALLSSVGHDLRSPLTAILGEIEALRAGVDAAGSLERLAGEALRLDRLIDNLLGMARIEAGEIRVPREAIDVTDAASAAADDVRASYGDRPITIRIPPDLPLVIADPQLLHHMLVNLLDNARKHGVAASAVIISARGTEGGVDIDVIDEGPGLPTSSAAQVFDRFLRHGASDRTPGSGLGLSIVRGFAAAMGLAATGAARSDGCGAVFTIHIPPRHIMPAELVDQQ